MKQRPKRLKNLMLGVFFSLIVLALGWRAVVQYQKAGQQVNTKLQVVASTNVWGNIAEQIGGDHVQVTSILSDPEADPHLYESDAQTASKVGKAQLIITNGLGYDEFMNKLMAASDVHPPQLEVAKVLNVQANANPHLWYNLPRVPAVAQAIEAELSRLDPQHAADYEYNLQQFAKAYQPVLTKLAAIHQKFAGKNAAYTERVAEYVLLTTGMQNRTPKDFAAAVESGSEPSPQAIQDFLSLLDSGAVTVLQYNTQSVNDVTKQILDTAKRNNVKVVGVTETLPPGTTFQAWQLAQLEAYL